MITSFTINEEMQKKIEKYLSGTESISQFCYKATEERLKRLEARDERAKQQMMERDIEALKPIILEMKERGII